MSDLSAACEAIEANNPPIKSLEIKCYFCQATLIIKRAGSSGGSTRFQYCALVGAADLWRRLGVAIGNNTSLQTIEAASGAVQSFTVMYEGILANTSIKRVNLCFSRTVPMFDIARFAQHNSNLREIVLKSFDAMRSEESLAILNAVQNCSGLRTLIVSSFDFRTDAETVGNIISACTKVKKLEIEGHGTFPYRPLVSLIENPRSALTNFHIKGNLFRARRQIDVNVIAANEENAAIAASLARNKKIYKMISSSCLIGDMTPFEPLLCDTSSIESIINSNHVLWDLWFAENKVRNAKELLKLNKNKDTAQVIRQKIARYYFEGEFDVTPFIQMPVSLIPNVMAMVQRESQEPGIYYKNVDTYLRSAIFRMLKNIPDLRSNE